MKKTAIFATITALLVLFGIKNVALANHLEGYNWNFLVSDDEFTDYSGFSEEKIQLFLESKGGTLKDYKSSDGRTAAKIIYDAAQAYQINPKALLVTIQKESSMLTRTTFSVASDCYKSMPQGTKWPCQSSKEYFQEWLLFYGWCDDKSYCYYGSPHLEKYRGLEKQITLAAKNYRESIDQVKQFGFTTIQGWIQVTRTVENFVLRGR